MQRELKNMQCHASWLIPLTWVVIAGLMPASANECLTVKVSPQQALAPVNLRVSVRIEPNADNRFLTIVAESRDFYRSSQIQLEGDRAPKTFSLEYPNMPSGEYEVTSVLVNAMGHERATARQIARVLPVGGEL